MLAFRCTKRLAMRLGLKLDKDAPASTGQLGDWYGNLIEHPAPLVVWVNGFSRLAIVIPALDADEVMSQFRMRLEHLLVELGIDNHAVREEIAATQDVAFAATNDRKIVGSMTDICFHVAWWLEDQGMMFSETALFKLEMQLAGMPHVKLKEPFPEKAVRARFGCPEPGPTLH